MDEPRYISAMLFCFLSIARSFRRNEGLIRNLITRINIRAILAYICMLCIVVAKNAPYKYPLLVTRRESSEKPLALALYLWTGISLPVSTARFQRFPIPLDK